MSVKLEKGHRVSLSKETVGSELTRIILGLGWDVGSGPSIDLDASCAMFDAAKNLLDTVYFGHLNSNDGSVKHSGDNLTGAGDGDDEQINVDLSRVPANVQSLVFTVNSYRGQTFDRVQNAFVRLVNGVGNAELYKYDLAAKGSHTALIMCKLYRHSSGWKLHALGETATGRTVKDLLPAIQPIL